MNTYSGSCHCKAITFQFEAELTEAIECNCSHCAIKGLILAFVPQSSVTISGDKDLLTTYLFNKQHIHHTFCSVCGVQPFGSADETLAINVRCLHDFDLSTIEIKAFDGKSW
jgi:hypothetical protein